MSFTDKVVLKEGTGATPQRGFTTKSLSPLFHSLAHVLVHFRASLENGSEFDTTDNHGPLTFCVGKSEILPGLEAIVMSMKQGEVHFISQLATLSEACGAPGIWRFCFREFRVLLSGWDSFALKIFAST